MKRRMIALLLLLAVSLTGCGYVVVEDTEEHTLRVIGAARAEAEPSEAEKRLHDGVQVIDGYEETHEKASDAGAFDVAVQSAIPVPAPLTVGARGDDVKALQAKLNEQGFMIDTVDGIYGARTAAGVKKLQAYLNQCAKEAAVQATKAARTARKKAVQTATAAARDARALMGLDDALLAKGAYVALDVVDDVTVAPVQRREDGVADHALLAEFLDERFPSYRMTMKKGTKGAEVTRLQTRLSALRYLEGAVDGAFGAQTQRALMYFQKRNGFSETGVADAQTQACLFSSAAKKSDVPSHRYQVKISVGQQKVYVYQWDYGSYSKLVKTMICSTGTSENPTPLGTFAMGGPISRWYYFNKFDCWAQYAYRIVGGILFHSVLYDERDVATLRQGSVDHLGARASHGCIRLSVADAQWLYQNVSGGTTCVIYK